MATAAAGLDELAASAAALVAELRQLQELQQGQNTPPVQGLERLLETHERGAAAFAAAATAARAKGEEGREAGQHSSGSGSGSVAGQLRVARDRLSFDLAVWDAAKRCRALAALGQRYRADWDYVLERPLKRGPRRQGGGGGGGGGGGIVVDAIVDSGATWVRLLTISERRLLFELAEAGLWGLEPESDTDADADSGSSGSELPRASKQHLAEADLDEVNIVRKATATVQAARNHRYRYRHPKVHIVLPGIEEGRVGEIDAVIARLRQLGRDGVHVAVDCANSSFLRREMQGLAAGESHPLSHLLVDELHHVTDTINVDVSWLIALASDLSHTGQEEGQAGSTGRETTAAAIRAECGRSLRETLYPTVAGRRLICAAAAADTVWDIAETLATDSEVARLRLILPLTDADRAAAEALGPDGLRAALARLSVHPVPSSLGLPVAASPGDFSPGHVEGLVASGRLPPVAVAVAAGMTQPNTAVFMLGWATGCTTVTANKSTGANRVRRLLELNRTAAGEVGPPVLVRWVTRTFDAKEKPEDWTPAKRGYRRRHGC